MKKQIKIFGVIALTLCLSGCNEFLNEVPDNRTEIDAPDKISQLLTSAYPKGNWAQVANVMGDGVQAFVDGSVTVTNDHAFHWRDSKETNQDSPDYFWKACYTAIANANYALEAIEQTPDPTQQQAYQRSEALLCRAFAHFLLVNLFAKTYEPGGTNDSPGIPYVDTPETVVVEQYKRRTVAYVYRRIQEDMEEGLATVAPESNFKVPACHFTEKAARAFASRFYLYKGDYGKVLEMTNAVIPEPIRAENGNVAVGDLANVWAATYFAPFKSAAWGTDPAIIEPAFRSATSKHNLLMGEGVSYLAASRSYRYSFANNAYLPGSSKTNITGGYWPWSIRGWQSIGAWYYAKISSYFYYLTPSTGYNMVMFPFFRAEELLLNRIEAKIHLNMLDAAMNDFNVYFRQRTGATSGQPASAYNETSHVLNQTKVDAYWETTIESSDFYMNQYNPMGVKGWTDNRKALLCTLLDTRRCEFFMEGIRWFDILRYKIPVTHVDIDGTMETLEPGDLRRVWQIPETAELSGLELNPR